MSLSLAMNVALWAKVHARPPAWEAHRTDSPSVVVITNRLASPVPQHSAKVTWQDLDDPSVPNLIANLRAVKCPELTIRDIVTARLDEQLDQRIAEINQPWEFWSTAIQKERLEQKQREKVRSLQRAEEVLIRQWFGGDWNRDAYLYWVYDPYSEFTLGFLPREKAMAIEFDIQDLERTAEVAFKGRDIAPQADQQELERLSRRLKSTLSPAEYAELNLRFLVSFVNPGGFPDAELSGGDVRYIATLYAKHLDFIESFLRRPEWFDLEKSAKATVQEEIRNYLGPDRYAAFQRANNLEYAWLHQFTLDAGLSSDTASKIFDIKAEASRQAMEISQNASLPADARTQQLDELRNTYRASLTQLIGESRTNEYAYRYGAWWDKLGEVAKGGNGK